jgi:hypothetical protein
MPERYHYDLHSHRQMPFHPSWTSQNCQLGLVWDTTKALERIRKHSSNYKNSSTSKQIMVASALRSISFHKATLLYHSPCHNYVSNRLTLNATHYRREHVCVRVVALDMCCLATSTQRSRDRSVLKAITVEATYATLRAWPTACCNLYTWHVCALP